MHPPKFFSVSISTTSSIASPESDTECGHYITAVSKNFYDAREYAAAKVMLGGMAESLSILSNIAKFYSDLKASNYNSIDSSATVDDDGDLLSSKSSINKAICIS